MQAPRLRRAVVAGVAASALVLAGSGVASADVPWPGSLCRAADTIQFYNTPSGSNVYTLPVDAYIRVVQVLDGRWAYGHGSGHSDAYFVWRYSDGIDRV
ncbi:hypothetical protein AB0G02_26900, partial [Actinosynnema sp. NPDC023658]|uniref:hypothetical protein n=1 Tax=Actinosynnema sp. NPDC023658 TaxID=3155465 RepID=UPI003402A651